MAVAVAVVVDLVGGFDCRRTTGIAVRSFVPFLAKEEVVRTLI